MQVKFIDNMPLPSTSLQDLHNGVDLRETDYCDEGVFLVGVFKMVDSLAFIYLVSFQ